MLKKIIKNYTPTLKALDTVEEQAKAIQDMYDQMREFYTWLSSPEFNASVKGEKGDKGDTGEQGVAGPKGDKGSPGEAGAKGSPGQKGDTGPKGEDGSPGPKGEQGERGERGERGPQGEIGPVGLTGPKGDKGDKGDVGEWFGLVEVYPTYADMVRLETNPVDAGFYLIAEDNAERGDLYVYNGLLGKYVFLNNIIYDLFFQFIQGPAGRTYLTPVAGQHINEFGIASVTEGSTTRDARGYLHTEFIFNYLKGNGIKSTKWTENSNDSEWSTLLITFDNNDTATIRVKNGNGIANIQKQGTQLLVDTYRVTYSNGNHFDYTITNGRGISKIEKSSTNLITDTYTITYNDNTTSTYVVTNGRGIAVIEKTNTIGLVDVYTITYNDNTTSTFTLTNGKGILYVSTEPTSVDGIYSIYTIYFNDGTNTTFRVKSCTPYEEAVANGYDKSLETFYGILLGDLYIGGGDYVEDVAGVAECKYENVSASNPFTVSCYYQYLWVIYPASSEFQFNISMSGFPVPMELPILIQIDDVNFYALRSSNQYNGTFQVTI